MRAVIIFTLFSSLLTGCPGKKNKDVDSRTGLSAEHYEQIFQINQSLNDINDALELARATSGAKRVSEKAKTLKEKMVSSGCAINKDPNPSESYDKNWNADYSVSGSGCPLAVTRRWSFSANSITRSWTYNESTRANTKDFSDDSIVKSFNISNGNLQVDRTNSSQDVRGQIVFSSFVTSTVGNLTGAITTTQSYNAAGGGGELAMQLNSRKDFKVKLLISWRKGRSTLYKINGFKVDKAVVDELFSAFDLDKIQDRTKNMLY